MPSEGNFWGEEQNPLFRIFASHAITSAVRRIRYSSLTDPFYEWLICNVVCSGIGKEPDIAQAIFDYGINNNTGLNSAIGFSNGSFFDNVQKELATGHFGYTTDPCRTFLSTLSAGLFFASRISNISTGDLNKIINICLGATYSGAGCGVPYGDFSNTELKYYFDKDWGQTVLEISQSEKNQDVDLIGFGYLDVEDLFSTPVNLKLMKDSEVQYYQLSGKLNYDPVFWETLPYCEEIVIPLKDSYGIVTGERVVGPANTPCIDEQNAYCPATGVIFNRVFCDGPYSSGIWTETVKSALNDVDKIKLQPSVRFNTNVHHLTNFSGQLIGKSVPVDAMFGEYQYPLAREQYNMPSSYDSEGNLIYELNHMGFTGVKWGFAESGFDEYGKERFALAYTGVTGFKYIPLELSRPLWAGKYKDVKYSPHIDSGRIFKLGLNVHSGYMIGEDGNIAGRPQRGLYCDLPSFIFYQNFSSETYKRPAFVKMGCGLTRIEYDPILGYFQNAEESDFFMGGWSDTYYYDPVEAHQPKAKINAIIQSNFSPKEDEDKFITEKTFGMGNSIDGGLFTGYIRNNAGYEYSGNLYNITGEFVSGNYFLWKKYSPSFVIGDGRQNVKYIKGYISNSGAGAGTQSNTSIMYAYNGDRTKYTYEYFDNRITPSSFPKIIYPQNKFCVKPVDELSEWRPVLGEQRTENFFPRYFKGPFATAHKKFLYPNAQRWHDLFFVPSIGFAEKIKFNLSIEEYATKEFFSGAQYNPDGLLGKTEFNYDPIGFKKKNTFSKTNKVDSNYAEIDLLAGMGLNDTSFTSGRNPLIYNSAPSFIQGFINDEDMSADPQAYRTFWDNIFYTGKDCSNPAIALQRQNNTSPVGLYTKYAEYQFDVEALYTRPAWTLSDSSFHSEYAYKAFPIMEVVCANPVYLPASDPLYLLSVAGNTEEQGGLHQFGIVGDQWLGLAAGHLGIATGLGGVLFRNPMKDDRVFLPAITSSGLDIHYRALKYFPNTGRQDNNDIGLGTFVSGIHLDISNFAFGDTYTFLNKERRGQLFDIPSGNGWLGVKDCYGNVDWPTITGFWSTRSGVISGWREQSKLVVTISPLIFTDYVALPFDVEHLCESTGNCIINGEFKYLEQGEASVYSEGCILEDITNDPVSEIYTKNYASEVMKRSGILIETPINRSLVEFPSKMISRRNVSGFKNPDWIFERYYSPDNYNKYIVPAISDFAMLNGHISYESVPEDDGLIFPNTTMLTSSDRGQRLADGTNNPNYRKKYKVIRQNQFYDSIMGDAIYNSGTLMTSKMPISEFEEKDGFYLAARGATILDIKSGIF
jgi:hypothetical protein